MKINWEKPEGDSWRVYEAAVLAATAFGRNAAPLAFTWLGWAALLALIRYAEIQTGLWPFTALKWILGFLLWAYFGTFHWGTDKVEWMSRELVVAPRTILTTLLAITSTGCLVAASYWLADVFMSHPL